VRRAVPPLVIGGDRSTSGGRETSLGGGEDRHPARQYGIDFLEQELLEFSIVTIPANSDALIDPGQLKALSPAAQRRIRDLHVIRARGEAP
jgi:hypothetical protein